MRVDHVNRAARRVPTWAVYILCMAPAPLFFYWAATGQLGVEPINALERRYGEIALQFLVVGLAITPLRRFVGVNLIKFRRAIGLVAFFYVALHLLVWLVLDVQALDRIWADILKRPYITVGMAGFLMLLPLAATSNNWSVRKLGPNWRHLHKATYAAVLLGAIHYVMLAKGFQLEPLLYLGGIGLLLLARSPVVPRRTQRA